MAEDDTNTGGADRPEKQPYGPGMLIIFGIGFLALGGYVLYAVYLGGEAEAWEKDEEHWKIYFNWGGAAAAAVIGIYCVILAAIRSKKGMPDAAAPAPERVRMDEPPSDSGAAEAEPPDAPADEAGPEPPTSDQ